MIDELFLYEKLGTLSQYVDELRDIAARPLQEYERDLFVKRTGERNYTEYIRQIERWLRQQASSEGEASE